MLYQFATELKWSIIGSLKTVVGVIILLILYLVIVIIAQLCQHIPWLDTNWENYDDTPKYTKFRTHRPRHLTILCLYWQRTYLLNISKWCVGAGWPGSHGMPDIALSAGLCPLAVRPQSATSSVLSEMSTPRHNSIPYVSRHQKTETNVKRFCFLISWDKCWKIIRHIIIDYWKIF